jgi:hypothetical protein
MVGSVVLPPRLESLGYAEFVVVDGVSVPCRNMSAFLPTPPEAGLRPPAQEGFGESRGHPLNPGRGEPSALPFHEQQ